MTADEVRARYSDLRNCDTQIWQDFDYLLKENARLRTALRNLYDEFCVMESSDGGLAAYVEAEKILAPATRQRNPHAIRPQFRRNRG